MKIKVIGILMVLFILFVSCSKEEEFINIVPNEINFVKENGEFLTPNDCINPAEKYNVLIKTISEGNGTFKPVRVDYTVNGISYSMTFMRSGTQINAVSLVNGLNIAQITETGYTATINYNVQGDFELVQ